MVRRRLLALMHAMRSGKSKRTNTHSGLHASTSGDTLALPSGTPGHGSSGLSRAVSHLSRSDRSGSRRSHRTSLSLARATTSTSVTSPQEGSFVRSLSQHQPDAKRRSSSRTKQIDLSGPKGLTGVPPEWKGSVRTTATVASTLSATSTPSQPGATAKWDRSQFSPHLSSDWDAEGTPYQPVVTLLPLHPPDLLAQSIMQRSSSMSSTPTAALAHAAFAAFAPPEAWPDLGSRTPLPVGQTSKVECELENSPGMANEEPGSPNKHHIYFTLPTHPSPRPQGPERPVVSSPIGPPEAGRSGQVEHNDPKSSMGVRRDQSIGSVIDISRMFNLGSDPAFDVLHAPLSSTDSRGSATSKPHNFSSSPAPSDLALRSEALPALIDYLNATRMRCGQSVRALELYAQSKGIPIPAPST